MSSAGPNGRDQMENAGPARSGPLAGLRIVEFAGIGPAPMAAMLLADLGAEVVRVDRPDPSGLGLDLPARFDVLLRSRRSVAIDLKHPDGIDCALDLVAQADALIEGFRPGVMEKLGLGPEPCLARNPRLVYGRVTGWGQDGPLSQAAGHDLNYIALAGVLHGVGRAGAPPTPPLNLVGDFGGGALYLALGIACGLIEAGRSGRGQVVDAAMVDGAASLMSLFYGLRAGGFHEDRRGRNVLDSGAPFYEVYACRDGEHIAVGPIEPKFRRVLLERLGVAEAEIPLRDDPGSWRDAKAALALVFAGRTRDEWCAILEGTDACFAPVLSMGEAPHHPHNLARGVFVEVDGVVQPGPAPRFSRTPSGTPTAPETAGASTHSVLEAWGFSDERIRALQLSRAIGLAEAPHHGAATVPATSAPAVSGAS